MKFHIDITTERQATVKQPINRREAKAVLERGGRVVARACRGYQYGGDVYDVNGADDLRHFNTRRNRGAELRNAECYTLFETDRPAEQWETA